MLKYNIYTRKYNIAGRVGAELGRRETQTRSTSSAGWIGGAKLSRARHKLSYLSTKHLIWILNCKMRSVLYAWLVLRHWNMRWNAILPKDPDYQTFTSQAAQSQSKLICQSMHKHGLFVDIFGHQTIFEYQLIFYCFSILLYKREYDTILDHK